MRLQLICTLLASSQLAACSVLESESASLQPPMAASLADPEISSPPRPSADDLLEQRWGLRLLGIERGAEQVVLHYRVLSDQRAAPVILGQQTPVLIPRRTGRPLAAALPTGRSSLASESRSSQGARSSVTRTYRVGFVDPEGRVLPGDAVDVMVGGLTITNLVVR